MAYRADIEIGVKGTDKLRELRTTIENLGKRLEKLDELANVFNAPIQSVLNYTKSVNLAAAALQKAELGTQDETEAIQAYVRALGEANSARQRQLSLIDTEIRKKQGLIREAPATGTFELGPGGPGFSGGFTAAQRQQANEQAILRILQEENKVRRANLDLSTREELFELRLEKILQRNATALENRKKIREATGSAIIGGAFPLLFGQGLGASAGGAAGGFAGGLVGGQFGFGLSLVGTAVGTAFDQLSTSAKEFAKASREGGDAASYLENTLGFLNPTIKKQIQNLQASGQTAAAAELAFKQLADVMGKQGAEAFLAIGKQAEATDISLKKVTAGFIGAGLAANKFFAEAKYGKNGSFTDFLPQQFRPSEPVTSAAETTAVKQRTDELSRGNAILALQAQLTSRSAKSELDSFVYINKAIAQKEYATELSKIAIQLKNKEINLAQNEQLIRAANLQLTIKLGNIERQRVDEIQRREQERQQAIEQATREQERLRQSTLNLNRDINEAGIQNIDTYADTLKALEGQEQAVAYQLNNAERYNNLKLAAFGYERAAALETARTAQEEQKILELYDQKLQILNYQLVTRTALLKTAQTQALYENLGAQGILSPQSQRGFARAKTLDQSIFMGGEALLDLNPEGKKIREFVAQSQKELKDLETVATNVSKGIGDSIANSFISGIQGLIAGTTTAKEVFATFLSDVGNILAQEGARMISTYIAIGIARAFAGLFSGGSATGIDGSAAGKGFASFGGTGSSTFGPGGITIPGFRAEGGPVSSGSPYIVGEKGPELFVPGTGGSVVPTGDLRSAMGAAPGSGGSPVLNMSFETSTINGVEYVSRDQLEAAMAVTRRQAARDGASRGMSMTLDRLQQSPSTRRRVGF